MSTTPSATNELWSIFDARRVKAAELRGLDLFMNGFVGWFKNRRPVLRLLRAAEEMGPIYEMLGHRVGHVVHESTHEDRVDHYRRNVVYCTSKELVADFLRDQLALGQLRNSTQTAVQFLAGGSLRGSLMVPGLFKAIIDEADSVLIDEALPPLIISHPPADDVNAPIYQAADALAQLLD